MLTLLCYHQGADVKKSLPIREELIFPVAYQIKVLESYGLVNPLERFYQFPSELEEADRHGIYLRVVPNNASSWIGFFSLGYDSDKVVNAVFSCPHADWLCVVAGGYGYLVNAADPNQWRRLEQQPVVDVRILLEQNLLLFASFLNISAVGSSGLLWTTERLSWEGLSISRIEGRTLYGLGWDAIRDKDVPFEVDLRTGKHTGGSRPGVPTADSRG
jgi:hypothetical protein